MRISRKITICFEAQTFFRYLLSPPIIDFSGIIPVFRVLDVSLALKVGLRQQEASATRNIAHSNLKTIPVTCSICVYEWRSKVIVTSIYCIQCQ